MTPAGKMSEAEQRVQFDRFAREAHAAMLYGMDAPINNFLGLVFYWNIRWRSFASPSVSMVESLRWEDDGGNCAI